MGFVYSIAAPDKLSFRPRRNRMMAIQKFISWVELSHKAMHAYPGRAVLIWHYRLLDVQGTSHGTTKDRCFFGCSFCFR